jgi:hypothetical protein
MKERRKSGIDEAHSTRDISSLEREKKERKETQQQLLARLALRKYSI